MNTGELIVELVLAGLLMLAALLFPAYKRACCPWIPLPISSAFRWRWASRWASSSTALQTPSSTDGSARCG